MSFADEKNSKDFALFVFAGGRHPNQAGAASAEDFLNTVSLAQPNAYRSRRSAP
jgi:hypothetical protein